MFESVINFFGRFNREQKLVLVFCVLVIMCTMYRDCILCKYVPKLDGFKMSKIEKFEDSEEDKEGFEAGEENKEDFENMDHDSMVLFYAPWCPHCKTVMGDWAKLKKAAPGGMKIAKVNCDEKPEMAEKHDIKGFPTIILFKGGKKVYFEGARNLENFLEFIKSN
jgi:thioredoxin-like negative regulator of GroEL